MENFLLLESCAAIRLGPCAYIEDFKHALIGSAGHAGGGLGRGGCPTVVSVRIFKAGHMDLIAQALVLCLIMSEV